LLLVPVIRQLDGIVLYDLPAPTEQDGALDPMIDLRTEPGTGRRLIYEGRILRVLAGEVGFDNEGVELTGFRRDTFLSRNPRNTGALECLSVARIDRIDRKLPLRSKGKRELDSRAVIRRISEGVVVQHIPRTIVTDHAGTTGIGIESDRNLII